MGNSTGNKPTASRRWPQSPEFSLLETKLLQDQYATPIYLPLDFLKTITSDFSEEHELRRGGSGVIYKVYRSLFIFLYSPFLCLISL